MRRRRKRRQPWWATARAEDLLDVRLCDLDLRIEGTALEARIDRLHGELERSGLRFRPYVWLSTDWFTPEGSTGFAIPFYLAHPRLCRLEHAQMLEAEGSTHEWCMQLLRHETGHALDNAYGLHRRRRWRQTFGRYGAPYRDDYRADPSSKDYVQNLGLWYAQSHPAEDYAETFAVWLTAASRWQKAYEGWPALRKLQQLDAMLREIAAKAPLLRTRDRPDSLPRLRLTLREHYRQRKAAYGPPRPWGHDRQLAWLFGRTGPGARREHAATFLRRNRVDLVAKVAALSGHYRYGIDQALDAMVARCRERGLRLQRSRADTRIGAAILLTMLTLDQARGRQPRFRR